MAETYKRLGAVSPSAITNTALYVASGVSAVICGLNVCNRNNAQILFRIAHVDGAIGALAVEDWIYYDIPVIAYDTFEITRGITMADTHTIVVYADTANVNFMAWGSEIT